MSSFSKKLKKIGKKLAPAVKKIGKVVQYAAPIAGSLLGGVPGALIGTAGGVGLRYATAGGNVKKKLGTLKTSAIAGGSVVAGTAALGLLSGAGLSASPITSLGKIAGSLFGSSPSQGAPGGAPGSSDWGGIDEVAVKASGDPVQQMWSLPTSQWSPAAWLAAAAYGALPGQVASVHKTPTVGTGGDGTGVPSPTGRGNASGDGAPSDSDAHSTQGLSMPLVIGGVVLLLLVLRKKHA